MKFSFLVPVYKSRFLKKALLSILSQNYDDYEVIVSDDASPENLKKIVDEIAEKLIKEKLKCCNFSVSII